MIIPDISGIALTGQNLDAFLASLPKTRNAKSVNRKLYIDFSSLCHHQGTPYGMLQVERNFTTLLDKSDEVYGIAWNPKIQNFIKLEPGFFSYSTCGTISRLPPLDDRPFLPEENSALLTVTYFWLNQLAHRDRLIHLARYNKIRLIPFIHDVIWEKFSYVASASWVNRARQATLEILRESSGIFTDSEASARDIKEFCEHYNVSPAFIKSFPVGMNPVSDPAPPHDKKLEVLLTGKPFILYVSALRIYKNHDLLLHLWRKLIAEHGAENVPCLVCVAYRDVAFKKFINDIHRDKVLRGKVIWVENIADPGLSWLYESCLFTVFPSLYEGWGIPVAESLAHGKICIASNTASIPEIAPAFTDLIDPLDFPSWYERLTQYIYDPSSRQKRELELKSFRSRFGDETVAMVVDYIKGRQLAVPPWEILPFDKRVQYFDRGINKRYLGAGWAKIEHHGAHLANEVASLQFILPSSNTDFCFSMEWDGTGNTDFLEVNIGGKQAYIFKRNEAIHHTIAIPVSSLLSGNEIQIEFRIASEKGNACDPAILRNFVLSRMPDSEKRMHEELAPISRVSADLHKALSSLLITREDIRQIAMGPGGLGGLLLWAWKHGSLEDQRLGKCMEDMKFLFHALHSVKSPKAIHPHYTCLIELIHSARKDLPASGNEMETQAFVVNWFEKHGIGEYNLLETLNPGVRRKSNG